MQEIRDDQRARVSISGIKDKFGNPAKIDGVPVWGSTDQDLLTAEADPDDPTGMKGIFAPVDGVADVTANGTVTVDADLGEGVESIIGVVVFVITGGKATLVELQVDSVEDKPEVTPPA